MQKNNAYYPYFDWLRIILASVVALYHDKVISWQHAGSLAVQVFFALSGWLIGGILLQLKKEDLHRFFFNRVLRIWVPYYFGLFLILVVSILKDTINLRKWLEFVTYKIFFVYNLFGTAQLEKYKFAMPLDGTGSHFWSVNAEEQFYLIAPLMLVILTPKLGRNIFIWFSLAIILLLSNIYASISFGVLAAIANTRYPNFYQTKLAKFFLYTATLFSLIGLYYNMAFYLIAPFFSLSVVLLLARKGKKNSLAALLGGISYPMYLNHWIGVFAANYCFKPFDMNESVYRKAAAFFLNILVALGLYLIIDKKILAMRQKLFTPFLGQYAMRASYCLVLFGLLVGLIIKYLFPIELS